MKMFWAVTCVLPLPSPPAFLEPYTLSFYMTIEAMKLNITLFFRVRKFKFVIIQRMLKDTSFLLAGLQPLLTLLTSEYAIIQQLSLESLIQITLDGTKIMLIIFFFLLTLIMSTVFLCCFSFVNFKLVIRSLLRSHSLGFHEKTMATKETRYYWVW